MTDVATRAGGRTGQPISVALLAPLPEMYRQSMDRYARALFQAVGMGVRYLAAEGPALDGVPRSLRLFRRYVDYPLRARRLRANLYHITDHGYAHLALVLPPGRTIVTFHDALLFRLADRSLGTGWRPRRAIFAQRFVSRLLPRVGGVLADSAFAQRELLRYVHGMRPERVAVVPLGVDVPVTAAEEDRSEPRRTRFRRLLGIPPGARVLLQVGRSDPHKNLEGTLRVLAALARDRGRNVFLLRCGPLLAPGQRELAARLGVEGRVRDLGPVSEETLRDVYQAADALLFLSLYEGFGLPVLEAFAARLPVVASTAGAIPEVAGDAALLVAPCDVRAAADAADAVLGSPERSRELVARGHARALLFSWKRTVAATEAVYRRVLGEAS